MTRFMESSAGRIAARIQAIGAGFDPEILSLPGGSFIAVVLWLYAGAAATVHRAAPLRPAPPQPAVQPAAAPQLTDQVQRTAPVRRPAAPHRPPFAAAACTCCCGQK